MQPDPIKHLLEEHVEILEQFAKLEAAVQDVESGGEAALPEAMPVFQHIGQMMATRLERHARKEDEALFPAVEAVVGTESPTSVMRQEHKDIHAQGVLLRETLYELNEVEHPQIEAGGERLRELAANGGSAESLVVTSGEILRLVAMHFEKEEEILFPMAYNLLSEEEMAAVREGMAAIDAEAS